MCIDRLGRPSVNSKGQHVQCDRFSERLAYRLRLVPHIAILYSHLEIFGSSHLPLMSLGNVNVACWQALNLHMTSLALPTTPS